MADKKLVALVQRLREKTLEGKLNWEKTIEDGVFQVSFPDYVVKLSTRDSRLSSAPRGAVDYIVGIYDENGSLIEEVSDLDFSEADFGTTMSFDFLGDLYQMARRAAMGVEKAIDSLLGILSDDEVHFNRLNR